jgi:hypothetical protein
MLIFAFAFRERVASRFGASAEEALAALPG